MRTVFDQGSERSANVPGMLPPPLAQLLTVTRANTAEVMDRLLLQVQTGETTYEELAGTEYLLFTCGGVECGVPLAALREVLPALPQVVPLPASPEWVLGIFALRTEIIALVDPVPMLLDSAEESMSSHQLSAHRPEPTLTSRPHEQLQSASYHIPRSVLIVGTGERCLAWTIALMGDIVRLEEHEIARHTREAPQGGGRVRERYIAGDYIAPQDGRRYTLLQTALVVDDVLHVLEEEPDGRA